MTYNSFSIFIFFVLLIAVADLVAKDKIKLSKKRQKIIVLSFMIIAFFLQYALLEIVAKWYGNTAPDWNEILTVPPIKNTVLRYLCCVLFGYSTFLKQVTYCLLINNYQPDVSNLPYVGRFFYSEAFANLLLDSSISILPISIFPRLIPNIKLFLLWLLWLLFITMIRYDLANKLMYSINRVSLNFLQKVFVVFLELLLICFHILPLAITLPFYWGICE